MDLEKIKNEYIDAANLHRESSFDGNHRVANKQFKILKKIYNQITENEISKDILVELLENESINVQSWAAAHMLGLNFNTDKAEKILKKIIKDKDSGLVGFNAEMTLRVWKEGKLSF